MIRALIFTFLLLPGAVRAAALTRGNPGEPESLDPARAGIEAEKNIVGDMLVGLTAPDAEGWVTNIRLINRSRWLWLQK